MLNGCPQNEGTVKHILIATTNPGKVAVSDLQDVDFINTKLKADQPNRWFFLKNAFKEEIANDEFKDDAGTFKTIKIGKTAGTDIFKYQTSQCLRFLTDKLATGLKCWVAYFTEQELLKVKTVDGEPSVARFFEVEIFGHSEKTTGTTAGLETLHITAEVTTGTWRTIKAPSVFDIETLQAVIFEGEPVSNGDATVTVKAYGCDLVTPVSDLTVGADGVNEFTVTADEVVIPGAVAFSGLNTYIFTRTAGTFATGEVVTLKYNEPSVTDELYISNIVSKVVVV